MRFIKRIERLETKVPKSQVETWEELLKRLRFDIPEDDIKNADTFLELVTNQGEDLKVWQR